MKAVFVALLCLLFLTSGHAATIAEIATQTNDLSTLVAAAQAAGLQSTLADSNARFTVFAPTNAGIEAFLKETNRTAAQLLADTTLLKNVLLYHVVPGVFKASDLSDGQELTTLSPGNTVRVSKSNGKVFVDPTGGSPIEISQADIQADNGIIHMIDGVLIPQARTAQAPGTERRAPGTERAAATTAAPRSPAPKAPRSPRPKSPAPKSPAPKTPAPSGRRLMNVPLE